jgi:hypothetical protein
LTWLCASVAWVDRTVATAVVSTSDQYDNLTRQHRLTRTVDGRVEERWSPTTKSVAREWLTTWKRLELCDTAKLDATRDYYVRVSGRRASPGASMLDGRPPSRVRRSQLRSVRTGIRG